MTTKLYVGNLAYSESESDLTTAFSECGNVESVRIITDRDTGKSKGFAFVEMADEEGAKQAVSQLDGQERGGRSIKVSPARPKEQGGGGSRSGGGGRGRY